MKRFTASLCSIFVVFALFPATLRAEDVVSNNQLLEEGQTLESGNQAALNQAASPEIDDEAMVTEEAEEQNAEASPSGFEEVDEQVQAQQVDGTVEAESVTPSATVDSIEAQSTSAPNVEYKTHVQSIGWQDWVSNGALAGTEGMALRMEAFNIRLTDTNGSAVNGISYQMHVQNVGWQDWVADGALGGTEGRSLRVEALRIKLSDELAASYDVWYCTHIQTYGWLGWTKNGEASGSEGYSRRMEAVRICILPKGEVPEGYADAESFVTKSSIEMDGHVQSLGWTHGVDSVGTVGRSLRLEAIQASLGDSRYEGSVIYSSHVQQIGWQDEVCDGALSGTTGEGLRLEAVTMRLEGEIANHYDIWYRLHVQTYGWLGWVSNGDQAGTSGLSRRVESIEVRLLPKGQQPSDMSSDRKGMITEADVEAANTPQALSAANADQLKLVQSANTTASAPAGYCAQWVEDVYSNAGFGYHLGDARDLYGWYCHWSELSDLKVGMIVAVSTHPHTSAGSIWGHVGIYVGDGVVKDSVYGYVRTSSLSDWINHYGATVPVKWGWIGDVSVA